MSQWHALQLISSTSTREKPQTTLSTKMPSSSWSSSSTSASLFNANTGSQSHQCLVFPISYQSFYTSSDVQIARTGRWLMNRFVLTLWHILSSNTSVTTSNSSKIVSTIRKTLDHLGLPSYRDISRHPRLSFGIVSQLIQYVPLAQIQLAGANVTVRVPSPCEKHLSTNTWHFAGSVSIEILTY